MELIYLILGVFVIFLALIMIPIVVFGIGFFLWTLTRAGKDY